MRWIIVFFIIGSLSISADANTNLYEYRKTPYSLKTKYQRDLERKNNLFLYGSITMLGGLVLVAASFDWGCPSGLDRSYLGYDCYADVDKEIKGVRSPPLLIGGVTLIAAGAYMWKEAIEPAKSSKRIAPYVATRWNRLSRRAIAGIRFKF